MNLTRILLINLTVFFVLLTTLEIGSGLVRVALDKKFYYSSLFKSKNFNDLNSDHHPCNEMKTDVLLSVSI
jgi:hypothetical protein